MKNIAIILAGGSGERLGSAVPKQFVVVAGKTILEHAISIFESNNLIDEIAIVTHPDYKEKTTAIIATNHWKKIDKVLDGGKERCDSTLSAIEAFCSYTDCNLLFHDAVRPLVTHKIINEVVAALNNYNAVGVAIATTDTMISTDTSGKWVTKIPDRNLLKRMQTPQGFKLSTITKAYKIALTDPQFITTDDCGVVSQYLPNETIFIVEGDKKNIKITYPEDIILLQHFLQ